MMEERRMINDASMSGLQSRDEESNKVRDELQVMNAVTGGGKGD